MQVSYASKIAVEIDQLLSEQNSITFSLRWRASNFRVPRLLYLFAFLSSAFFTYLNFSSLAKLNGLLCTKHVGHAGSSNRSAEIWQVWSATQTHKQCYGQLLKYIFRLLSSRECYTAPDRIRSTASQR